MKRGRSRGFGRIAALEELRSVAVLAIVLLIVGGRRVFRIRRGAMAVTMTAALALRCLCGGQAGPTATDHGARREGHDCKRSDDLPKDHGGHDTHAEPSRKPDRLFASQHLFALAIRPSRPGKPPMRLRVDAATRGPSSGFSSPVYEYDLL